jgi:hypothetical protein
VCACARAMHSAAAYLSGLERRAEHQACRRSSAWSWCGRRRMHVLPSRRDTTVCSIMAAWGRAFRTDAATGWAGQDEESGGGSALQRRYVSDGPATLKLHAPERASELTLTHGPPSVYCTELPAANPHRNSIVAAWPLAGCPGSGFLEPPPPLCFSSARLRYTSHQKTTGPVFRRLVTTSPAPLQDTHVRCPPARYLGAAPRPYLPH